MQQPPEKRLVAVHKFQSAERGQDQRFFHLLDLPERGHGFAHHIIAQDGDAVVGAARTVVEIFCAAKVGAPVREKGCILPLHLLPDGFPPGFRVVQSDFGQNLLFAGLGVEHMAVPVKLQFAVFHTGSSFRFRQGGCSAS